MGAVKLKEQVNIKQDTETFILIEGGNLETQGLRDQEGRLKKPHAFIVIFGIMSSEDRAIGAGYGFFFYYYYYFKTSFIILKVHSW